MGAHTFHLLIVERTNNSKDQNHEILRCYPRRRRRRRSRPGRPPSWLRPCRTSSWLRPCRFATRLSRPCPRLRCCCSPCRRPSYCLQHRPIAAPAHIIPAAPKTYAVPPARIINEPAHVETIAEKVEQHGYKIKY